MNTNNPDSNTDLSYEDLEIVKDSLKRCLANPLFLEQFYKNFIGTSAQIAEQFKNTNFAFQKIMLKSSLHIMVTMASGGMQNSAAMDRLATVHDRQHRNIKPEWYLDWLEALINTIKEIDSLHDAKSEQLWRIAMQPGIAYMQLKY
jgi:hemoglobin-like flavoprotein